MNEYTPPQPTMEELIATPAGLALANAAFTEGAAAGFKAAQNWPMLRPVSPYRPEGLTTSKPNQNFDVSRIIEAHQYSVLVSPEPGQSSHQCTCGWASKAYGETIHRHHVAQMIEQHQNGTDKK